MRRRIMTAFLVGIWALMMLVPSASAVLAQDPDGAEGSAPAVSIDRRDQLLAHLGSPDSWVLTTDEIDGDLVRFESWSYHEAATQIDLVDGEILWSVHLDPLPDGALYPLAYEPGRFELLSSPGDIRRAFPDTQWTEVKVNDKRIPGATFLAGEQLLLGFVDDQLIYAEAFVLVPEVR